jgi:hypothetical protein
MILVVVVVVVVGVVTWAYTFFELHMKWALLRSGVQGLRALSFNVHKLGKNHVIHNFLEVLLEGQESRYT